MDFVQSVVTIYVLASLPQAASLELQGIIHGVKSDTLFHFLKRKLPDPLLRLFLLDWLLVVLHGMGLLYIMSCQADHIQIIND